MSNRNVISLVVIALVVFLASQTLYIVTEKERAVQLRFGEVVNPDVQAGLHLKAPFIDNVRRFDGRVLTNVSRPERFLTVNQEPVNVDAFVKWRISDPRTYYGATAGDELAASERLSALANDGLRSAFGTRTLYEVVSGERDQLMLEIRDRVDALGREALGIQVVDIRIKGIDLPQEVSNNVYTRMATDREKLATEIRARGSEQAEGVRANADRQRTEIVANAFRQSQIIRGEGDAIAAQVYAQAFTQDEEFYSFWRSLQAYRDSFTGNDLFVLEPESDFFRYLNDGAGNR